MLDDDKHLFWKAPNPSKCRIFRAMVLPSVRRLGNTTPFFRPRPAATWMSKYRWLSQLLDMPLDAPLAAVERAVRAAANEHPRRNSQTFAAKCRAPPRAVRLCARAT